MNDVIFIVKLVRVRFALFALVTAKVPATFLLPCLESTAEILEVEGVCLFHCF